jgi:hypothetical protein
MSLTKTQIANIALSNLGNGKDINNVDTDTSAEARAVRTYWDMAVDVALKAWNWPFATAFVELGLVEENPNIEWCYSYRYPSDCINARRIVSGNPRENSSSLVPYMISSDTQGALIFTNKADASLEYTTRIRPYSMWTHDFVLAFSAQLAFFMAPRLTSRESGQQQALAGMFASYVQQARANAYNEMQSSQPPEAESIRAREGDCYYGPIRRDEV